MDRLLANWNDGGWGMWPILVFGVLTLLTAARFTWRGEHNLTPFIRWMLATTAMASVLGFTTGMQAVCNFLRQKQTSIAELEGEDWRIRALFEGTKEASNCLSFGMILITLTCLLLAIGHRRFPAPEAG